MKVLYGYIIDARTKGRGEIVSRLKRLAATAAVEVRGEYREDQSYSQIALITSWGEDELNDWLYRIRWRRAEYVGAIARPLSHRDIEPLMISSGLYGD